MTKQNTQVVKTNTGAATLTSAWYLSSSKYPLRSGNILAPYFSGQDIFRQIANSIKTAKTSLDIVCWGFDPAMPIIRDGNAWSEDKSYGGLLIKAAERGVKVRLLLWYYGPANSREKNLPGMLGSIGMVKVKRSTKEATNYSSKWFNAVQAGKYPNIEVVFRDIKDQGNISGEDERSDDESLALNFPSDHQKSFVADYGTPNAHGYVMGHNSLTEYWDTASMNHNEPLREPGKGPWHDFSLYVKGPILIDLNANFCESWDDNCDNYSHSKGDKLTKARKGMESIMRASPGRSMAQIVRTRPDKTVNNAKEKEIRRAYLQVAANPRRYVLIVNQYFQYARWVRELKKHFQAYKQKGARRQIYIFAFTPQPQSDGMIFRTHQMANELGVSEQVGTGDEEFYKQLPNGNYELTSKGKSNRAAPKQLYQDLQALGIETVFCNLKTKVNGQEPKDIYIHAKLMVIDDEFFTLGSANLNIRSMAVDSELNIISDDDSTAFLFRNTLLGRYCGGSITQPGMYGDMGKFFGRFKELANKNRQFISQKTKITGHAASFADSRSAAGTRVA